MARINRMRMKRIRNLVAICTIIAIVLSVSTYAWFIGMRTVNVASFDVEIKSTESLMLSLNGNDWSDTLTLDKAALEAGYYTGHTNKWPQLIPMSSVGEMDATVSRMKLYEKASLTPTSGGYRLLASRADNTGGTEADGYVVFDLFVKNFSGNQYITALNEDDEEAIYLTTDSSATVAADGVANTGIENSVRVAFAQIGRVIGTTTTQGTITGITCTSNADVTGICREAQIWEPNDKRHVAAAISWYDTACYTRSGANVTLAASYSNTVKCATLQDGTAYDTYAVKKAIASTDNVDVYDGADYNGYTATSTGETALLKAYPYFTDTMKLLTGTARPKFMSLAPNSITKVRVYIYIEGQDVDNYDFSSIGKKISIKFGFTKERFTPGDIEYGGPEISTDTQNPIVSLEGANPLYLSVGGEYVEAGAIAIDNVDGNITSSIVVDSSAVNTAQAGTYSVTYTVEDAAGNQTVATRTVIVK